MVAPSPAVVIGWSWGAMLGLSFATRFRDRVSNLLLVGCGTYDAATRELLQRSINERSGVAGRRKIGDLQNRLAAEADAGIRDAILGELGAAYMEAEAYDLLETGSPADDVRERLVRAAPGRWTRPEWRVDDPRKELLHHFYDPFPEVLHYELAGSAAV